MSEQTSAVERRVLGSWKEVAAFLRVTVRTAQRWEQLRALPVHRLGSRRNSRVLAYTDELAAWVAANDQADGFAAFELEKSPAESGSISRILRLGLRPLSITGFVAVLVVVGFSLTWWSRPGPPVRWRIDTDLFQTLDKKERVSWEKEIPGLRAESYTSDGRLSTNGFAPGQYDGVLHHDIDGDGAKEWLINRRPLMWDEGRGQLVCLSDSGEQRWEFPFGVARRWKDRNISANYAGLIIRPVSIGGKHYVLTVANHAIWFPSQVALLDASTGRALEEYWHPGGLFVCRIWDIDKDGSPELLLAGINNPGQGLGHSALVALRLPFSKGGRRPANESVVFGEAGIKEMSYLLFPRPDTFDAEGQHPVPDTLTIVEGNRLLVRICQRAGGSLFYYLDSSLKLVECQLTESLSASHKRLQAAGQLDHAWSEAEGQALCRIQGFAQAPDGNSREVASLFQFPLP